MHIRCTMEICTYGYWENITIVVQRAVCLKADCSFDLCDRFPYLHIAVFRRLFGMRYCNGHAELLRALQPGL